MPQYKLTYFNARGRAEVARLIFAAAGQEYEDVRLEREQWQPMKPNTPNGQLPVLEVDGTMLCQSNAFSRYLAKQFGMAGKDDIEQAKADAVVDCLEDAVKPLIQLRFNSYASDTQKAEMKKKYEDEQLPAALANLEKMLCSNNGGDGFFVGDTLTWADISFFQGVTWPDYAGVKIDWDAYPKLAALKEKVGKIPKIAEWIEKRPKTEM